MVQKDAKNEITNPKLSRRATSRFAERGEVDEGEKAILETETGRAEERDPEDVRPDTPLAEGAPATDVSGQPVGEETAPVPGHDRDDNLDGLNEMEETVRRAAERPLGAPEEEEDTDEDEEGDEARR